MPQSRPVAGPARHLVWPALAWVALLAGSGCHRGDGAAPAAGGRVMPATQVIAAEARRQPVAETLSLVGTLAANEMIELKSEVDGTVEEIRLNEGQLAAKGDLLVRLDERKLAAAVAEAEANHELHRLTYERNQRLLKEKLVSQQDYDQTIAAYNASGASLELKRQQLRDAKIYAPFAGMLGARSVSPGQVIARNTTLGWLVDLDTVKLEVAVPERFLGQLRAGQPLELAVAAFPGEKFKGEVYFIGPQVDPVTRTVFVKARVTNPDRKLRPGMFANLELTLRLKEQAIVIPESAVMASGDRNVVYVIGEDGTAQLRPVQLGTRLAGQVEVTKGLNGGEQVVAEGLQKVRPGGKVKSSGTNTISPTPGPKVVETNRTADAGSRL